MILAFVQLRKHISEQAIVYKVHAHSRRSRKSANVKQVAQLALQTNQGKEAMVSLE